MGTKLLGSEKSSRVPSGNIWNQINSWSILLQCQNHSHLALLQIDSRRCLPTTTYQEMMSSQPISTTSFKTCICADQLEDCNICRRTELRAAEWTIQSKQRNEPKVRVLKNNSFSLLWHQLVKVLADLNSQQDQKKIRTDLEVWEFWHPPQLHQSQMIDCFTAPHVYTKVSQMSNKNAANPCHATAGSVDVLTDVCDHNNSTHNWIFTIHWFSCTTETMFFVAHRNRHNMTQHDGFRSWQLVTANGMQCPKWDMHRASSYGTHSSGIHLRKWRSSVSWD